MGEAAAVGRNGAPIARVTGRTQVTTQLQHAQCDVGRHEALPLSFAYLTDLLCQ